MTWYEFSERVVILQTDSGNELAQAIQESDIRRITDVIPTEKEIAVEHSLRDPKPLIKALKEVKALSTKTETEIIEIPVCFELGLDWNDYEDQTGKKQEELIKEICSLELTISYGFIPGFLYLSGLPTHLHSTRKSIPRKRLPTGSVGIGREKTGRLEHPWQNVDHSFRYRAIKPILHFK